MGQRNIVWDPAYVPAQSEVVAPAASTDYEAEWRIFAFRRNLALRLLWSWLPVTIALFLLSRTVLHEPVACLAVIIGWLFAAMYAVWWSGEFRCPRCKRRYGALGHEKGSTNLTRGIFDAICANCTLRKFEQLSPRVPNERLAN